MKCSLVQVSREWFAREAPVQKCKLGSAFKFDPS